MVTIFRKVYSGRHLRKFMGVVFSVGIGDVNVISRVPGEVTSG